MSIDELIEVLKSAKDGNETQMLIDGEWKTFDVSEWVRNFTPFRVAPEPRKPREWWIFIGNEWQPPMDKPINPNWIHVREVIA